MAHPADRRKAVDKKDVGEVRISLMSDGTYKVAVTAKGKTLRVTSMFPGSSDPDKSSRANVSFEVVSHAQEDN